MKKEPQPLARVNPSGETDPKQLQAAPPDKPLTRIERQNVAFEKRLMEAMIRILTIVHITFAVVTIVAVSGKCDATAIFSAWKNTLIITAFILLPQTALLKSLAAPMLKKIGLTSR